MLVLSKIFRYDWNFDMIYSEERSIDLTLFIEHGSIVMKKIAKHCDSLLCVMHVATNKS